MTDPQSPRLAVLMAKLSKTVYRKAEEALPGMSVKDYMALTNLDDRGRHIVEITPHGKKVLERAERGMAKLEEELLAGLSASERATLKQLVLRVLQNQAAAARQPEAARP